MIHNKHLDLRLFGKQLLSVKMDDWNCLNIIYTPKTKEFHLITDDQNHFKAKSFAEVIFHSSQEPYGTLFYEYYKNSNCEYALTLDDKPILIKDIDQSLSINFSQLFEFKSQLLSNPKNEYNRLNLPVIFGAFKPVWIDVYDQKYHGYDDTYLRHTAILQNELNQFLMIRFSEYQVDYYDLKENGAEPFSILVVGMTKLFRFSDSNELIDTLLRKCSNQKDLRSSLDFLLGKYGLNHPKEPTKIFK